MYQILIKSSTTSKFQAYRGWDIKFATRADAAASLADAKRLYHRAKLVRI